MTPKEKALEELLKDFQQRITDLAYTKSVLAMVQREVQDFNIDLIIQDLSTIQDKLQEIHDNLEEKNQKTLKALAKKILDEIEELILYARTRRTCPHDEKAGGTVRGSERTLEKLKVLKDNHLKCLKLKNYDDVIDALIQIFYHYERC